MTPLRVNVVFADLSQETPLIRRLESYASRAGGVVVHPTESPLPERSTDCYAVPISRISELTSPLDRPPTWKPIVAYGPPAMIRVAFAEPDIDYLKEPWTPEELHFRVLKNSRGPLHRFAWGELSLDRGTLHISHRVNPVLETTIELGHREALLLDTLLSLRGEPAGRELLSFAMQGTERSGSRAVDMQIHGLRETLGQALPVLGGDGLIKSVYGKGYLIS